MWWKGWFCVYFRFCVVSAAKKSDNYDFGTRYTGIWCTVDNKTVSLKFCYLKAYSRRVVTGNIGVTFLRPLIKPTLVEMIYSYRYGTIYREVIHSPKIDWCTFMESGSTNPFILSVTNEFRDSAPNLFQKCPFTGDLDLINITALHCNSINWKLRYTSMIQKFFVQS